MLQSVAGPNQEAQLISHSCLWRCPHGAVSEMRLCERLPTEYAQVLSQAWGPCSDKPEVGFSTLSCLGILIIRTRLHLAHGGDEDLSFVEPHLIIPSRTWDPWLYPYTHQG